MSFIELCDLLAGGNAKMVAHLQDVGILRRELHCKPCARPYSMVANRRSVVGLMLRCPGCRRKRQLRTGTFLEGTRLPLEKFVALLYLWAHEFKIGKTVDMTGVSSPTAVHWYRRFATSAPGSWTAPAKTGVRCPCVTTNASGGDGSVRRRSWLFATCSGTSPSAIRSDLAHKLTPGSFQSHSHAMEDTHNLSVHAQHYRLTLSLTAGN